MTILKMIVGNSVVLAIWMKSIEIDIYIFFILTYGKLKF